MTVFPCYSGAVWCRCHGEAVGHCVVGRCSSAVTATPCDGDGVVARRRAVAVPVHVVVRAFGQHRAEDVGDDGFGLLRRAVVEVVFIHAGDGAGAQVGESRLGRQHAAAHLKVVAKQGCEFAACCGCVSTTCIIVCAVAAGISGGVAVGDDGRSVGTVEQENLAEVCRLERSCVQAVDDGGMTILGAPCQDSCHVLKGSCSAFHITDATVEHAVDDGKSVRLAVTDQTRAPTVSSTAVVLDAHAGTAVLDGRSVSLNLSHEAAGIIASSRAQRACHVQLIDVCATNPHKGSKAFGRSVCQGHGQRMPVAVEVSVVVGTGCAHHRCHGRFRCADVGGHLHIHAAGPVGGGVARIGERRPVGSVLQEVGACLCAVARDGACRSPQVSGGGNCCEGQHCGCPRQK